MRLSASTFVTAFIAVALLITSIFDMLGLVSIYRVPEALQFLNPVSLNVIIGGLLLYLVVSWPREQVNEVLLGVTAFFSHTRINNSQLDADMQTVLRWQAALEHNKTKARNELSRSLENTFEGYLFMLISTNYKLNDLRSLATEKLAERYNNRVRLSETYDALASAAPGFGMLGTLIGLVHMLANFDSAETLGRGLAFALMTTLYGLLMAYLLFSPLANKTRHLAEKEHVRDRSVMEGMLLIHQGAPPIHVYDRLAAFRRELKVKDLPEMEPEGVV